MHLATAPRTLGQQGGPRAPQRKQQRARRRMHGRMRERGGQREPRRERASPRTRMARRDVEMLGCGTNRIAVWMLDTNFDGRSLFPHQVFFPMAGEKDGWARLARNLKSEINEELIEAYRGNVSLPFTIGSYKRIAVKIVDDRGIESLKLIDVG